jgi:hypothetical protein
MDAQEVGLRPSADAWVRWVTSGEIGWKPGGRGWGWAGLAGPLKAQALTFGERENQPIFR